MGVDAPVDEVPHDRFLLEPAPAAPTVVSAPPPAASGRASPPSDALIAQAEQLAATAGSLEELRTRWEAVPGCMLSTTARMIFAGGTAGSPLMLIAGAPGADDERQGEAFQGPPGRLLDAMLAAVGLDRSRVYLANVVPWRPPGNRQPTPLELALNLPFARRHIALAAPSLVLCLGERAAQPLLASRDPVSRMRGRWLSCEVAGTTVRTLVTFAPDYLLRQPLQKRRAWLDLRMIQDELSRTSR